MQIDRRALLAASLAAAAPASAHAQTAPIAHTQHGRVRGATIDGVHVFKGVRYGADTAARRFQAPLAPRRWSSVRERPARQRAPAGDVLHSRRRLFIRLWLRSAL